MTVPTALTVLVLGGWVGVAGAFGSLPVGAPLSLWLVLVLVVAGNVLAAFRGAPTFMLRPQMVVAWYAVPALSVVVLGSLVAVLTKATNYTWLSVVSLARLRRARVGGLEGPAPDLPAPGLSDNPFAVDGDHSLGSGP